MTEDQVLALFSTLSNRGRWGSDDELGTLNYIDDDVRRRAAALVTSGITLSLAHDLSAERTPKNPIPLVHHMLYAEHTDPFACIDVAAIAPHGWAITHLDALGHIYFEGEMYNGRRAADAVTPDGMAFGSIMAAKEGVVSRGVLLDIAAARGVEFLEEDDAIGVADLEAAEQLAQTTVRRGDIVVTRCGLEAREAARGPADPAVTCGILPECLPWFHEREIAVYSGDIADKEPTGYPRLPKPLHQVGLVAMGLCLLDNVAVEELAAHCAGIGRWEFLMMIAPLRIPGATGSAVNPLALF